MEPFSPQIRLPVFVLFSFGPRFFHSCNILEIHPCYFYYTTCPTVWIYHHLFHFPVGGHLGLFPVFGYYEHSRTRLSWTRLSFPPGCVPGSRIAGSWRRCQSNFSGASSGHRDLAGLLRAFGTPQSRCSLSLRVLSSAHAHPPCAPTTNITMFAKSSCPCPLAQNVLCDLHPVSLSSHFRPAPAPPSQKLPCSCSPHPYS